jgi:hypothetical protein
MYFGAATVLRKSKYLILLWILPLSLLEHTVYRWILDPHVIASTIFVKLTG